MRQFILSVILILLIVYFTYLLFRRVSSLSEGFGLGHSFGSRHGFLLGHRGYGYGLGHGFGPRHISSRDISPWYSDYGSGSYETPIMLRRI